MRQIILRHPGVSEISRLSLTEIAGEEMAFDKYHTIILKWSGKHYLKYSII